MTKQEHETFVSFLASLHHWGDNARGKGDSFSGENCALCKTFSIDCSLCPIKIYSGATGCKETPWFKLYSHVAKEHFCGFHRLQFNIDCPECMDLVREEYIYLLDVFIDWISKRSPFKLKGKPHA